MSSQPSKGKSFSLHFIDASFARSLLTLQPSRYDISDQIEFSLIFFSFILARSSCVMIGSDEKIIERNISILSITWWISPEFSWRTHRNHGGSSSLSHFMFKCACECVNKNPYWRFFASGNRIMLCLCMIVVLYFCRFYSSSRRRRRLCASKTSVSSASSQFHLSFCVISERASSGMATYVSSFSFVSVLFLCSRFFNSLPRALLRKS